MRWIAFAIALAGCSTPVAETYTLIVTEARVGTELRINGASVDLGGSVPRMLTITYDFNSAADAMQTSYLLETFGGGTKLAELTIAPRGCDGVETEHVAVAADGKLSITADDCAPAM